MSCGFEYTNNNDIIFQGRKIITRKNFFLSIHQPGKPGYLYTPQALQAHYNK
ncbi:MAG: hypothetical protein WDO19_32310 [Bacteroidota bacterium]